MLKPEKSMQWSRRVFSRAEAFGATLGLGALLVLLCALAASSWWTFRSHRQSASQARYERLQVVAGLLGGTAESMIASGKPEDLSSLRRLVAEASLNYQLTRCRLLLPDNRVIADASPRAISVTTLPESWPSTASGIASEPGQLSTTIQIPGRGPVILQLSASDRSGLSSAWELLAGMGVVASIGLVMLGVLYRVAAKRLRALGAIREALAAAEGGEQNASALSVSGEFGASASAWNTLLRERDELRQRLSTERAIEKLATRNRGDGDLSSACDAMWHGLVLVDPTLKVKYANGAAAVFLGHKRDEIGGMPLERVFDSPQALEAIKGVMSGKVRGRQVVELKRERSSSTPQLASEGDRRGSGSTSGWSGGVLRLSIRPVRRDDSAAAMILIEDVTQQRVADEARNAFVAQATHELRTPLTSMRLYIEQLQDDTNTDVKEREKAINVISQESRRLERIVGDMLSVAEIEAGSMRLNKGDVRLDSMCESLKHDFEKLAHDKEITLRFDLPPKFPVMKGDRDKIMLAAHNLIGNAIKYTPVGGQVTVRIEEAAGQLVFEVIDNGIGIREDEIEKVFERFYRAKDKRVGGITGSGLGLALAREVVRMHGGDITLRSQIDKGSTFVMTLPISAEPSKGGMKQAA